MNINGRFLKDHSYRTKSNYLEVIGHLGKIYLFLNLVDEFLMQECTARIFFCCSRKVMDFLGFPGELQLGTHETSKIILNTRLF